MNIIHEFSTPKAFGNVPSYHLWIEQGNKYHYICQQRNTSGAGIRRVVISAKEALLLILKGAEFADDWMATEYSKSVRRF